MSTENIDWSRVVHFYGRATEVPSLVQELKLPESERALSRLEYFLEHQDAVLQATPLAVAEIVNLVKRGEIANHTAISALLEKIERSARFQWGTFSPQCSRINIGELYSIERMWPQYESDEEDEALWEEWNSGAEELAGWAWLTMWHLGVMVHSPLIFWERNV